MNISLTLGGNASKMKKNPIPIRSALNCDSRFPTL
jgi:hypothetical protein